MKSSLIIASGQGMIPFVLLGLPSAAIGIVCVCVAAFLASRKNEDNRKAVRWLCVIGVVLIVFMFVSPTLDRAVYWILDRALPKT